MSAEERQLAGYCEERGLLPENRVLIADSDISNVNAPSTGCEQALLQQDEVDNKKRIQKND